MPVTPNFQDNNILYAANLNSAFSQAANTSGENFTKLSIQNVDIGSGLSGAYSQANSASTTAQAAFNKANNSGTGSQLSVVYQTTNGLTVNNSTSWTVSGNGTLVFSANTATTSQTGIVQLNDTTTSTSTSQAATANAVNTVWAYAQSAFAKANTSGSGSIGSLTFIANTSQPGLTVNNGVTLTVTSNNTIILGANAATTGAVGVVQLNDTTTSTATSQAGTANSVNTAMTYAQGAFARANILDGIGSITFTATSGVAVGGGSTQTLTANGTVALTGNTATTGAVGVVQLNDTTQSTSTSLAATANSVNTTWAYAQSAFSRANTLSGIGSLTVTATGGVAVGGGSTQTLTANGTVALTANSATTGAVGVVQLNDTTTSTSTSLAATANSVNTAWSYAVAAFAKANTLPGAQQTTYIANTSQPGLTVNNVVNVTLAGNNTLILGANAATTGAVGVVQLNDTTTSTSTTQAATANSVNTAWSYAVAAYSRANTIDGIASLTVTATGGVAVGGGSTQTLTANGTVALTANAATTGVVGVVQLNDTTTSTSTSLAATANSVNTAWSYAVASFNEANSFQSVINSAFTTANSGQNLALSAFAEANSFQSIINSAFTQANTTANIITPANNVIILGSGANSRGMMTQMAYANGTFANTGDASWATFLLRNQSTSSANTYTLSLNGANSTTTIYSSINQIILGSNNYLYAFSGLIGARDANNNSKVWSIQGAIKRGAGQSTTAYIGTPVINIIAADSGTNAWAIGLTTDTTNAAMLITATGSANVTNWVSKVDIIEIG